MEGELPLQWCVCAGVPGSIDPDHGNDPGLLAPPQASSYSLPAPGMHKLKLWGEVQGRGQSQLWQQHPTLLQWGHPLTLCSVLQRQPDRPSFLCCFFFFFSAMSHFTRTLACRLQAWFPQHCPEDQSWPGMRTLLPQCASYPVLPDYQ